jgi:hypothetical protein
MVDTLIWATDCDSKGLIMEVGARHVSGRRVRAILDVGSAMSEEIVALCPNAEAYYFIDSLALCRLRASVSISSGSPSVRHFRCRMPLSTSCPPTAASIISATPIACGPSSKSSAA